jgi:hypothetical protein
VRSFFAFEQTDAVKPFLHFFAISGCRAAPEDLVPLKGSGSGAVCQEKKQQQRKKVVN